jgi:hypothetical protein
MSSIESYTLLELVGTLDDSADPGSASARLRKHLREIIQQDATRFDELCRLISRTPTGWALVVRTRAIYIYTVKTSEVIYL